MHEVILAYRAWKAARAKYKASLRREGAKGPIVRRSLRELIKARHEVTVAIRSVRDGVAA